MTERKVLARGLGELDHHIIGRHSGPGDDARVELLEQGEARFGRPPHDERDLEQDEVVAVFHAEKRRCVPESVARELVDDLHVHPENMERNLGLTRGLYFSQSILLALTRAGLDRKTAYEAVQRAAMKTWEGERSFAENVKAEPAIASKLSPKQIDELCSLDNHFRHVDETFSALGLDGP